MHLNIRSITAEQSSWINDTQILVEGSIALPEGSAPMQAILDVSGTAEITEARIDDGKLYLVGIARFKVLYTDIQGEFGGFDAETEFSHLQSLSDASPETNVLAWCHLGDLTYAPVDGHSLTVQCIVEANALAACNQSHQILDGAERDRYAQLKERDVPITQIGCMRTGKTFLHTQVRVPQSLPAVKRVLSERGYAVLRKIVPEDGQAALEGELKVFIIYESTDKNAPLQYFEEVLPFGDVMADDALRAGSELFAVATLESLATQPDTENTDILNISAAIGLCLTSRRREQVRIVEDLYHEQQDAQLHYAQLNACRLTEGECTKKVLRLSAELPADAPDVSRILFAGAYPRILSTQMQNGVLNMDGILSVDLCYTTAQSGIRSTQLHVPFETAISYTPNNPQGELCIQAFGEYAVAEGSGRELEIKCCLDLCIHEVQRQEILAVRSAALSPAATEKQKGILIYYADGRETLWDIAKKFKVKQDVIRNAPDTDTLPRGHKLILVSR